MQVKNHFYFMIIDKINKKKKQMKFQFALLKTGCAGSIRVIGAESEIDE